jgi:hypothetical protein
MLEEKIQYDKTFKKKGVNNAKFGNVSFFEL